MIQRYYFFIIYAKLLCLLRLTEMAQMFIVPNGIAEVFTQVKKAWATQQKADSPLTIRFISLVVLFYNLTYPGVPEMELAGMSFDDTVAQAHDIAHLRLVVLAEGVGLTCEVQQLPAGRYGWNKP